jgi:hypothetical protein
MDRRATEQTCSLRPSVDFVRQARDTRELASKKELLVHVGVKARSERARIREPQTDDLLRLTTRNEMPGRENRPAETATYPELGRTV